MFVGKGLELYNRLKELCLIRIAADVDRTC
jgi:hypothetical protein